MSVTQADSELPGHCSTKKSARRATLGGLFLFLGKRVLQCGAHCRNIRAAQRGVVPPAASSDGRPVPLEV
jgi:hypothetical protein